MKTKRQTRDPEALGKIKSFAVTSIKESVVPNYYSDREARAYLCNVVGKDINIVRYANFLYGIARELHSQGVRLGQKLGAPPRNHKQLLTWVKTNFENGKISGILDQLRLLNKGIVYDSSADCDRDILLDYENLGDWRLIDLSVDKADDRATDSGDLQNASEEDIAKYAENLDVSSSEEPESDPKPEALLSIAREKKSDNEDKKAREIPAVPLETFVPEKKSFLLKEYLVSAALYICSFPQRIYSVLRNILNWKDS
jgi:hypothetical protein